MSRSDSYSGEHTKYPPLISCLTWGNVWTMLEVFPDGLAVCRHNTGNKTSSSSIIQLVSQPRLPFWFYLGYLTFNLTKIFPTTRMSNCFLMSMSAKQIIRLNYYSLFIIHVHKTNKVGNNSNCSNNTANSWLEGHAHLPNEMTTITTTETETILTSPDHWLFDIWCSGVGWNFQNELILSHLDSVQEMRPTGVTGQSIVEVIMKKNEMHVMLNHKWSKKNKNQSACIYNKAQTRTTSDECNGC